MAFVNPKVQEYGPHPKTRKLITVFLLTDLSLQIILWRYKLWFYFFFLICLENEKPAPDKSHCLCYLHCWWKPHEHHHFYWILISFISAKPLTLQMMLEDLMYLGWDPFEVYGQALWWSRRSTPQCLICKLCVLTPTVTSELIEIRCFSSLPRTQHDSLNSTPRSEVYKTRHLHTIIYTLAIFLARRTKLTSLSLTPSPQTYLNNSSDHNGPPRSRLF